MKTNKQSKPEVAKGVEKSTVQGPLLSRKEIAKYSAHWKRLELTVYQFEEYFALDIHPIMESVMNFYAKYGVFLRWQEGEADSSLVPHLARVKERTETGLPLKDNPDLEFFWEHFEHTPTIFFVGDICVKGRGGLRSWFGPDVPGFTFLNTFVFVAYSNAPWIPQYDVTVARELGHVLGLSEDPTGVSLMSRGYHAGFRDNPFLPIEAATLRQSPWLRRMLDPKPASSSPSGSKRG